MKNEEVLNALTSHEFDLETLTKKSETIKVIDDEIKEIAKNLEIAMKITRAEGISAPQIGIHKRIIAYRSLSDDIEILINPEIIDDKKGIQCEKEGCLSFPHMFGKVYRSKEIRVKGLNLNGEEVLVKAQKRIAAVLLHELDHLNGDLFLEKINGRIEDPYGQKRIYDAIKEKLEKDLER